MVATTRAFKIFLAMAVLAIIAVVVIAEPTFAETDAPQQDLEVAKPGSGEVGAGDPLTSVQKKALSQGYLVPDQAAYERAKSEAARKAGQSSTGQSPAEQSSTEQSSEDKGASSSADSLAPRTFRSFEGPRDPKVGPPDTTGAIGVSRYIELVNQKFAIYSRANNNAIAQGTLADLAGEEGPNASVFDPQIIWDPNTNRFFYVADDIVGPTDTRIAFGFSKNASPSSADDFCKYTLKFGNRFPDYPKLGDTANRLLIGANSFDNTTGRFYGTDLISVTKPPAGTDCPDKSSFAVDKKIALKNANGTRAFTAVPANQTDTSATGWVVAEPLSIFGPGGIEDSPETSAPAAPEGENYLSLFKVVEGANGTINLSRGKNLNVPRYDIPASAPQRGTRSTLDTLDARNTQAVSAVDPARGRNGSVALWTQHTIFGGAGAKVRWYEINPGATSLYQSGNIEGAGGRYAFNAAISPDRKRTKRFKKFGRNMALGFSTSSNRSFPDIRTVSKIGDGPVSRQVVIKRSAFALDDFTCGGSADAPCRWGDYSAATPDPGAPLSNARGRVWLSNQFVKRPGGNFSGWGTWNWAVVPGP